MNPLVWAIVGGIVAALVVRRIFAHRSPQQVAVMRAAVGAGGLLLDVRTQGEFVGGHAHGAVNIPLQALPKRTKELGDKGRAVVVCCASGSRSRAAAGILRRAGYRRVLDLGSWTNWGRA